MGNQDSSLSATAIENEATTSQQNSSITSKVSEKTNLEQKPTASQSTAVDTSFSGPRQLKSAEAQHKSNDSRLSDKEKARPRISFEPFLSEKEEVHEGITCKACKEENFQGYRYKCAVCIDYNLCDDCFQSRKTSDKHKWRHTVVFIPVAANGEQNRLLTELTNAFEIDLQVDHEFKCADCGTEPIRGVRLQCDDCFDFNLCFRCYKNPQEIRSHNVTHSMVAHLWPLARTFDRESLEYLNYKPMSGCFSSVTPVQYKDKFFALKSVNAELELKHKVFQNEVTAYQEVRCNHIVKFFGSLQQPNLYYLLLEFMQGGSLKEVIREKRDVSIRRKLQWLTAIAKGLRCIHRKGFVHKDLKPENILFSATGNVKICDFGIAAYDDAKGYYNQPLVSRRYAAPEILLKEDYTNKVDIFSFGLMMNELFTYTPYPADEPQVPLEFAVETVVMWPLVQSCVNVEAKRRPSAAQIVEIITNFVDGFSESIPAVKNYAQLNNNEKDKMILDYYLSLMRDD